jgi:hypothetical protein
LQTKTAGGEIQVRMAVICDFWVCDIFLWSACDNERSEANEY